MPSVSSSTAWWPGLQQALRRGLRWSAWLVAGGASILLTAWLTLQWGILPRIEHWHAQIEARASEMLGVRVHIGAIEATPDLWATELTLRDVQWLDANGHLTLQLAELRARLVPGSLLPRSLRRWEPTFAELRLDRPQLELRRDGTGQLWIAGIALPARTPPATPTEPPTAPPAALQWLLRQGTVRIHAAQIDWLDELNHATALSLTGLDLTLQRRRLGHELQVDAELPARWQATPDGAHRLHLQARWTRPLLAGGRLVAPADWHHWSGRASLTLPPTALAPASQALGALLAEAQRPRRGVLAGQTELSLVDGQLQTLQADIDLQDLALQWRTDLAPLDLTQLQTRLSLQRDGNHLLARLDPLRWQDSADKTSRNSTEPPAATLTVQLDRDAQARISGGQVNAARLDLARLARLAAGLPLSEPARRLIAELAPQGQLQKIDLRWSGPPDAPQRYQASGQVEQLGLRAQAVTPALLASHRPGRPGLSRAQLDFSLDQAGGHGRLRIDHGTLDLPGVFEAPSVALDRLDLPLRWQVRREGSAAPAVEVQFSQVRLANADAAGEVSGRWRSGTGSARLPGLLDLDVQLSRADATRVHRYLPLALAAATRDYVRNAVLAGQASRVSAQVHGDLRDFPYTHPGSGVFRLQAEIEAGRLAYVPPEADAALAWPLLTDLSGSLIFEGSSMRIERARARVGELGSGRFELHDVQGGIADFASATLRLHGQGSGPLADLLAFTRASPVGGWIGDALAEAHGSGTAGLQLGLDLPLDDLPHSRVQGSVQLSGNDLQLRPNVPLLAGVQGAVEFSERGFRIIDAHASALGGPLAFGGGLDAEGRLHFSGSGRASATGLRGAPGLPDWLTPLATQLSGSAAYDLTLDFSDGQPAVTVRSDLAGLAAAWPAPLGKTASMHRPLSVHLQPQPAGPDGALRSAWHISAAEVLDLQLQLEARAGHTRLRRGSVGLGRSAPELQDGLRVALHWPEVALDDWLRWYRGLPAAGTAPDASQATHPAFDLPVRIDIDTPLLSAQGLQLSHLQAQLQHDPQTDPNGWQLQAEADQLAGQVHLALPAGAAPHLQARLSRLTLPAAAPATPTDSTTTALRPPPPDAPAAPDRPMTQPLPELDIVVEALQWQDHPLGRLDLQAAPAAATAATAIDPARPSGWRLDRLSLSNPAAQLNLSGRWNPAAGGADGQSALNWRLDLHDSGALLARFGQPDVLSGGQGRLEGRLSWHGRPWAPDMTTLEGLAHLALGSGQVLQVDTGLVRLLGLLNLQSLPRRLLLDFRDVTQSGFSFDRIDGNLQISHGIARTSDLRLQSVMANVEASGSANLARATQDLQVRVLPELNAGAASLAYAAVNPVLGIGTLLGQWVLQKPLANATAREFHITGSFAEPLVTPITGTSTDLIGDIVPPGPTTALPSTPPSPTTERSTP
ncbi:MAG: hypothetical protein RLY71_3453 [Pseudomonadota bacterium]|jgi:uncharacterized protein (TIGR02099 family)